MGPFPCAARAFEFLYIAIDKFTKWPVVDLVRKVTTQTAIKLFKGLVCRFGVPNRVIADNGKQFTTRALEAMSLSPLLPILGAMDRPKG